MLGVRPDASTAEIRAAQRRLALELHPDRHASTDPRRRSEVAERMAEVNAAAAVLADPTRRAAYDRSRTPRPRRPDASATFTAAGPAPPLSGVAPSHPTVALAGAVPWIALVAVLVGIFVFTAYAGGGDGEGDAGNTGDAPPATVAIRDLRGRCVQESGGFTLIVDCAAAPHDGRIVAQGSIDAACPAGTRSWTVPQQDVLVCTDPATATR